MSVAENVEFALSIRGVSKAERRRRRDERWSGRLAVSVGVCRASSPAVSSSGSPWPAPCPQPEVLLLDEPFGALDAKVRLELRRTIREIQRELGITTIFVTTTRKRPSTGRSPGRPELRPHAGDRSAGRALHCAPRTSSSPLSWHGQPDGRGAQGCRRAARHGAIPSHHRAEARTARRVQILFRPRTGSPRSAQDRAARLSAGGRGAAGLRGSFERLRLRLPPVPGVRATRRRSRSATTASGARPPLQDQARRFRSIRVTRPGSACSASMHWCIRG